jgi:hypothetical protein
LTPAQSSTFLQIAPLVANNNEDQHSSQQRSKFDGRPL